VVADFALPYRLDCCCDIPLCDGDNDEPIHFPLVANHDYIEAVPGFPVKIRFLDNDIILSGTDNIKKPEFDKTTKNKGKITLEKDKNGFFFTYTAIADIHVAYPYLDTFTYSIIDMKTKVTDTAIITVLVRNKYIRPVVARDDIAGTDMKTTIDIDVMANDISYSDTKLITLLDKTQKGAVIKVVEKQGTQVVRYTPAAVGRDTFEYALIDDKKAVSSATVTVMVCCCEEQPNKTCPTLRYFLKANKRLTLSLKNISAKYRVKILKITGDPPASLKVEFDPGKDLLAFTSLKPYETFTLSYAGLTVGKTEYKCNGSILLTSVTIPKPLNPLHLTLFKVVTDNRKVVNKLGKREVSLRKKGYLTDASMMKNIESAAAFIGYMEGESSTYIKDFSTGKRQTKLLTQFQTALSAAVEEVNRIKATEATSEKIVFSANKKLSLNVLYVLIDTFFRSLAGQQKDIALNGIVGKYINGQLKKILYAMPATDRKIFTKEINTIISNHSDKPSFSDLLKNLLVT